MTHLKVRKVTNPAQSTQRLFQCLANNGHCQMLQHSGGLQSCCDLTLPGILTILLHIIQMQSKEWHKPIILIIIILPPKNNSESNVDDCYLPTETHLFNHAKGKA